MNSESKTGDAARREPQSIAHFPSGFKSPFVRVEMEERMDDAFACIAILAGKSLEEVNTAAIAKGYPAHGPAYPTEELLAKLLMSLGGLVASNYQDFISIAALPAVAILVIDWDEEMETGRHIVWHHVKGTDSQQAFNYVVDPAPWISESEHFRTDVEALEIYWFIEVRPANIAESSSKLRRSK